MKRLMMVVLVLGGCANYQPIIDTKGVDMNAYHRDLAECQQFAQQISPATEGAVGGVAGGAIGAALGAIAGAFLDDPGTGAAIGASYGGAYGVLEGSINAAEGQADVVKRCMSGRGYSVLR